MREHLTSVEIGNISPIERTDSTPAENKGLTPIERGDHIATYREIAARFVLSGPNAARTKVKRAGWVTEPANHPGDPLRVRVPRDDWVQAIDIPHLKTRDTRGIAARDGASQKGHLRTLERALELLREQLARERGRADAAGVQADAGRIQIDELARRIASLHDQLQVERSRADLTQQGRAAIQAELELARVDAVELQGMGNRLEAENRDLRQAAKLAERVLREAETTLTAERAAREKAEGEGVRLRQAVETTEAALVVAREAHAKGEAEAAEADQTAQAAVAEAAQLRQARAEAELTTQAAKAEAAQLRQTAEEAVQEAAALRQAEAERAAAQAAEAADRPTMVVSRIDEVQLRRLQEAEQARKSLGRLARLRLAWRGE